MSFKLTPKLKALVRVTFGGLGVFGSACIYKGNEKFYKTCIMPAAHFLDPEDAHNIAIWTSKHRLLPKSRYNDPDLLNIKVFGRKFDNPIGMAAGFDKHGEAVLGLTDMGFGFVEIGSVTPEPQPGNDKPRVFRLYKDNAVINRFGFNSDGHNKVYKRLTDLRTKQCFKGILGVNLGKNKLSKNSIEDYVKGIEKFGAVSDYLVINISSPNTPGLRNMQGKEELKQLLAALIVARDSLGKHKPPLLLKIAPDLSEQEVADIAHVIQLEACRVDGLIISNTTVSRPSTLQNGNKEEAGGLSGQPLNEMSTKMISQMYKLTNGQFTIIGVGGIFSGKDAYDKIKAGASVVQIFTSLVYEGPPVVAKIKRELADLVAADGFSNVSECIGKDVR